MLKTELFIVSPELSLVVLVLLIFLGALGIQAGELPSVLVKKPRIESDYVSLSWQEIMVFQPDSVGATPLRCKAAYTGKTRDMIASNTKDLSEWANAFAGNPDSYTQDYRFEIEVRDGKNSYWLGIRNKDLQGARAILVEGNSLDIFLIRVGGHSDLLLPREPKKNRKPTKWLFLVEGIAQATP